MRAGGVVVNLHSFICGAAAQGLRKEVELVWDFEVEADTAANSLPHESTEDTKEVLHSHGLKKERHR